MKFAVILSGCGVYDGSEIHESVMTLLAIERNGGKYRIFAPNVQQHHVINHLSGEVMDETRNVLIESARIARGDIKPLKDFKIEDFDAVIFPGGFGVAKNLCSYAFDGPDCRVDERVERVILETHKAGKPIGALCISPVLIVKVLGKGSVTIGSDNDTATGISSMGGKHVMRGNGEVMVDHVNLIVTNPCYMIDASINDIFRGAENTVKEIINLINR